MLRTFEIRDKINTQGFARFTVRVDNGSPYEENPPVVTTNDPMSPVEILLEWLKAGKKG